MNVYTLALIALISLVGVSLAASPPMFADPNDPLSNPLMAPIGFSKFLTTHGRGVQIYACDLLTFQHSWTGERLILTKDVEDDKLIGTGNGNSKGMWHYEDNSYVTGVIEREVDTFGDMTLNIPWRLFRAETKSLCGRLSQVEYIHRVNTRLGKPVGGCNETEPIEVPFEADYYFWRRADYKLFNDARCKNYDFSEDFVNLYDAEAARLAGLIRRP